MLRVVQTVLIYVYSSSPESGNVVNINYTMKCVCACVC
jgi:hypothetical protein